MKNFTPTLFISLFFGLLLFISQETAAQLTVKIVKVPDETLDLYTGEYAIGPNFVLTFTKDGDHLKVSPAGQTPIPIFPESQNKFFDKERPDVTMEFVKETDGTVKKVILTQDGRVMEARKLQIIRNYNPEKEYSAEQLKEDFNIFRNTLEKSHPRLYEFTPKQEFDNYFDSLYHAIKEPMNEIEFRYFLLPAVSKVHCGHTSLAASYQFEQYHPTLYQPFILYYEESKAYIRYSAYPELKPGTEVLSINDEPVKKRIDNFLQRVTGDGIHPNVQYWRMNQPVSWITFETPEWFNVKAYKLLIVNPDKSKKEINLQAINRLELIKLIPPPLQKQQQLKILENKGTAIFDYPFLDFPNDSIRNNFLNKTFSQLKEKKIKNLIIDLRGNGGGAPENAAYFLRYLMKNDFIYSNTTNMPNLANLTKPISVAENRFTGKMYFLIDGGCFSSTGHLLSLVKYYNLGPLVGELTSATYSCNTNGEPHSLPNTDLILYCPTGIYETAVKGFERARGIAPDYEVKNTLHDILTGKDQVLEYTLGLIGGK